MGYLSYRLDAHRATSAASGIREGATGRLVFPGFRQSNNQIGGNRNTF
jgi:hypothetical protein